MIVCLWHAEYKYVALEALLFARRGIIFESDKPCFSDHLPGNATKATKALPFIPSNTHLQRHTGKIVSGCNGGCSFILNDEHVTKSPGKRRTVFRVEGLNQIQRDPGSACARCGGNRCIYG